MSTLGCRLNEAESASWARAFARLGHRIVSAPERAQLLVLNTCAVTAEASRKSRKTARRLRRCNPQAKLALTGCFAALEPERCAELAGVDWVIGNRHKDRLVSELLRRWYEELPGAEALQPSLARGKLAEISGARTRAFVKVQDGCRNRCTFCVVTVARGEERSRSISAIVEEINALHAAGYQEVVLTGVHLGGYGADLGTDLKTLVAEVLRRTAIPRVRLSSLEPWDLPGEFWSLWDNPRLCPHLHLPLQSASDRVLRRMARRCTRTAFETLVEQARARIPGLMVTTDIIVGFPQESEVDFEQTLQCVKALVFSDVHIFSYSPRAGTAAAKMSQQLCDATKQERSRRLHRVTAEGRQAQLLASLGQSRPVLWETQSGIDDAGVPTWTGLTDNYLRVETSHRGPLANQITNTRLCSCSSQGLLGQCRGDVWVRAPGLGGEHA